MPPNPSKKSDESLTIPYIKFKGLFPSGYLRVSEISFHSNLYFDIPVPIEMLKARGGREFSEQELADKLFELLSEHIKTHTPSMTHTQMRFLLSLNGQNPTYKLPRKFHSLMSKLQESAYLMTHQHNICVTSSHIFSWYPNTGNYLDGSQTALIIFLTYRSKDNA